VYIIYINYLPLSINSLTERILFADDNSVIIASRNFCNFGITEELPDYDALRHWNM